MNTTIRDILIGLFVAVVGGVIVAWFIQEGRRFQPQSQFPVTVTIQANAGWSRTGLILPVGQSLQIIARGTVDYDGLDPLSGRSSPDGDGIPCDKEAVAIRIGQKLDIECLIANNSYGALVGRIGNGAPFLIGSSNQFVTGIAGELFLGVNDCCNLTDNSGEFTVTIY